MKLTTKQCIILFNAINNLDGSPRVVAAPNGKPGVVVEPYDLSDKVQWNAGKNRRILREIVELVEEKKKKLLNDLAVFRGTLNKDADPKENEQRIDAKTAEIDAELDTYLEQENDVALLKLPAVGFKLKINRIMPSTLERLMDIIDGTPEFDDAPKDGAKPS